MSEEQTANSQSADSSKEKEFRADRDGYLEFLIHLVEGDEKEAASTEADSPDNEEESPIYITLNVGGLIVTGTLISRDAFVREVPLMRSTIGAWEENMSDEQKKATQSGYDRHYIHLKDARFIFPNSRPVPNNQGMYWRGRLNSVDGWTQGSFQTAEEA